MILPGLGRIVGQPEGGQNTGLEEINDDLPEDDFWGGMVFRLPSSAEDRPGPRL